MKNYARSVPEDHYHCRRFLSGQEELLEVLPDGRPEEASESDRRKVRELLEQGMKSLSERERAVLSEHYGLESRVSSSTLEQIGRRLGVTKERIRQIERQALSRLREILDPALVDAL
jgi:RNA polymerase sigma factor (sigma-70 family)